MPPFNETTLDNTHVEYLRLLRALFRVINEIHSGYIQTEMAQRAVQWAKVRRWLVPVREDNAFWLKLTPAGRAVLKPTAPDANAANVA